MITFNFLSPSLSLSLPPSSLFLFSLSFPLLSFFPSSLSLSLLIFYLTLSLLYHRGNRL